MQGLSNQECRIVKLVAEGMTNKEIASELHIAEGTVKVYLHKIFAKLRLNSRTKLATWFIKAMAATIVMAVTLFAQVGSVTFTPPTPGRLVVSTGANNCTLVGNAIPATTITATCKINNVTKPDMVLPFVANEAFTFGYNAAEGAITITLSADATGKISYQAAATPSGGATVSGSGSF